MIDANCQRQRQREIVRVERPGEANGGDWLLERSVGQIEAGRAFETITLEEYDGLLQVFTATDAASLIAAITTANGNTEAATINLAGDITLTAVDNATN